MASIPGSKGAAKKGGRKPGAMPSTAKMRFALTVAMGVIIPLFSLALSHVGGTLARAGGPACYALSALSFGLMACVLAVSLSHLAWAVGNITRSPQWASWLLAVSFDLALVLCELCHVGAADAGVGGVTTAMMITVCGLSQTLNVWAFLRHPVGAPKSAH